MTTTITFTVYRRPFYLRDVLEMWREVRGIRNHRVLFNIDPSDQMSSQQRICQEFADWHGNAKTHTNHHREGVLRAPWVAINRAFVEPGPLVDKVIVAEEDVAVSDDALEYLNWSLDRADIACAWSDGVGPDNEAEWRKWFNPWCWGLTREVWESTLRDTWDMTYSHGGWDVHIGLDLVPDRDLKVMFPKASRSQHIGKWLGTHQDPNQHGDTEMPLAFAAHRPPLMMREAYAV